MMFVGKHESHTMILHDKVEGHTAILFEKHQSHDDHSKHDHIMFFIHGN